MANIRPSIPKRNFKELRNFTLSNGFNCKKKGERGVQIYPLTGSYSVVTAEARFAAFLQKAVAIIGILHLIERTHHCQQGSTGRTN